MPEPKELRHHKNQDPVFIERTVSRPFDPEIRKMKIANWIADLLYQDFLERKGLVDQKRNGI